jgi:aminopeptidase-like protein
MKRFADHGSGPRGDIDIDLIALINRLYPICRSITGDGVRRTLSILSELVPVTLHEVPSGTKVFDWTVPREWSISDAYVVDPRGRKVIDFRRSNLHVVNYSVPVRTVLSLAELRPHLHTLADRPDWIPYRTSYYDEDWGFCLRHRDYVLLEDGDYEVVIDASLQDGNLTYGEAYLPGETEEEVLLSTHVCHPSLANDNLSGIAVLAAVARSLVDTVHRYSYRLLFIPGTIGAITWLARNQEHAGRIQHGLVVAGVGDRGPFTYKRSRRGTADIDRAVIQVLQDRGREFEVLDFSPYGYDERQFCSPGFDLPVGRFSRSEYGRYPEYHNSGDNLDFITEQSLVESWSVMVDVLGLLETNRRVLNQSPCCEPQLGRRGLYNQFAGVSDPSRLRLALLWVLNLADGRATLLDIAERSQLPYCLIREATRILLESDLLAAEPPIADGFSRGAGDSTEQKP